MEFLSNKPLLITDTILRDAHQSQAATRMTIEDMLPALEQLDSIGYYSLECWGGATFDACMRFLNEDPWERLRTIRRHVKNTKLQMLFRGQNILGYKHYADDVVDAFCAKSIENGIDIIRIFDALNDVRNLEQAIKSTKKYGGQVEATLSYTMSPIHNEAYFVKLAKELEDMGADMICIKDMANLLLPMDAYSLVKALKETINVPIHLHTHNTSGTGDMTLLMAAYAGVDIVDTALSPMANGTSQPATESLVATLQGTWYSRVLVSTRSTLGSRMPASCRRWATLRKCMAASDIFSRLRPVSRTVPCSVATRDSVAGWLVPLAMGLSAVSTMSTPA